MYNDFWISLCTFFHLESFNQRTLYKIQSSLCFYDILQRIITLYRLFVSYNTISKFSNRLNGRANFELRAPRVGVETRPSIGRSCRDAEGHRPVSASACYSSSSSSGCHQYTRAAERAIADHWSSIPRPIIGKVPTKISNVSSQIIKHQPDTRPRAHVRD